MTNLKIIVGSIRPTRSADRVVPWITRRASSFGPFETEVLDLREWNLPLFQEHPGSIGDISDPIYSSPKVRDWNRKIKEAEAIIIVTPEYLHGMPGLLKNALDNVFVSWALRNKPVAAISYSTGIAGGSRAIENLAHVAIEAEMILLRNSVILPYVDKAFNEEGEPTNPLSDAAATIMLQDLEWWAKVLGSARKEGELPPASARLQAILKQTD